MMSCSCAYAATRLHLRCVLEGVRCTVTGLGESKRNSAQKSACGAMLLGLGGANVVSAPRFCLWRGALVRALPPDHIKGMFWMGQGRELGKGKC
eukprot:1140026-Pelagomonas_calceolata.AAC.7